MISHLGRYEILDVLGQGAMGIVYRAKDPLLDRVVAIKTINLSLAQNEKNEYEARLYQEAKAAGCLSHPNIVTIYDVGESGDVAYIAMEFLQGRELSDILKGEQRLPVDQVLDIAAQVAQGLAYAHRHDIVHRDIKPSNIIVVGDGQAKITDFGIARMISSEVHTKTGMVLGSPKYMSPEQVLGKLTDRRSDIFSLGVVLYEMLTGQAPFAGENFEALRYQTLNTVPPPPGTLNPALPDMINFIVVKALAKALDDRYQDAQEFADDLRTCRASISHTGAGIVPAVKLGDVDAAAGKVEVEESKPLPSLSTAFDSFEASMRLAAMTRTAKEMKELSQTFKRAYPNMDTINQPARAAVLRKRIPFSTAAAQPAYKTSAMRITVDVAQNRLGNWLLIIIIALDLAGLAGLIKLTLF